MPVSPKIFYARKGLAGMAPVEYRDFMPSMQSRLDKVTPDKDRSAKDQDFHWAPFLQQSHIQLHRLRHLA